MTNIFDMRFLVTVFIFLFSLNAFSQSVTVYPEMKIIEDWSIVTLKKVEVTSDFVRVVFSNKITSEQAWMKFTNKTTHLEYNGGISSNTKTVVGYDLNKKHIFNRHDIVFYEKYYEPIPNHVSSFDLRTTNPTKTSYLEFFDIKLPPRSNNISGNNSNENIRIRIAESEANIDKVAVIGKESKLCDDSDDDGQDLAELVEGELLGIYGVVERKHLKEILDEQKMAMSGLLLEDSDFAQAGCLAGAQGTVIVSYGCLQGKTKLQIKLVDCSTSDLYWSAIGLDISAFDLMDVLRVELSK